MASGNCGCSSTSATTSGTADSGNLHLYGKFRTGVKQTFLIRKKNLRIKQIRTPNVVVFSEDPCLAIGDTMVLQNKSLMTCFGGTDSDCYTVAATPVQVGSNWEVTTDATWTKVGVQYMDFQAALGYGACGTTEATKTLSANICAGVQNPANWSGEIYTRPLNTPPITGAVNVTSGSAVIKPKTNFGFRPQVGDSVTIANTNITGANAAIALEVAPDGEILLDREVGGITVAVDANGTACVRGTAKPRVIARPVFTLNCKCGIVMTIDQSITGSGYFPLGKATGKGGQCPAYDYCFVVMDNTPGAEIPVYSGILTLD